MEGVTQMVATEVVKDNVDINLIDSTRTIYNVVSNIYAKNEANVMIVYAWVRALIFNCKSLIHFFKNQIIVESLRKNPNLTVYYKHEVPERYHFQNSNRIGKMHIIVTSLVFLQRKINALNYKSPDSCCFKRRCHFKNEQ